MKYYFKEIKEGNNFLPVFGEKPFHNTYPLDRSGILDTSIDVLSPIPSLPEQEVILNDEINNRAKELLSKSQDEGKELRVAWSGGVDSTTVLSALINNRLDYPGSDIKVCLNQESIQAYPWFYNKYIKDAMDVYESNAHADYKASGNGLADSFTRDTGKDWFLVTGETADQITGPKFKGEGRDKAFLSYQDGNWSDKAKAFVKPLVDARPEGWTEKAIDVNCWVKLVCNYQWTQVRMSIMYGIGLDKITHFFSTDKFQQWWLQTPPSVRYAEDLTKYKPEFQGYIKGFCGDSYEMKHTDSLPVTTSVRPRDAITEPDGQAVWTSLDEDFNREQRVIPPPIVTTEEVENGVEVTISSIEIHL